MVKKRDSPPPRYKEVYAPQEDMSRPCGIKCCKVFLIVLNFIFLVSGFAILGLGIWMEVSDTKAGSYMQIFHDTPCEDCMAAVQYFKIPYILMAVGSFVLLLSFLGCCGSWAESTCLLCLYSMFLFLILIAEIGSAVFIGIYKNKMTKCLECSMQHQVRYNYNQTDIRGLEKTSNKTDLLTVAWDTMQTGLECCGSTGPQDYYNSGWYNFTNPRIHIHVPPSCCVEGGELNMNNKMSCQTAANPDNYDPDNPQDTPALKTLGCHKAFIGWLQTNVTIALAVLTAVVVLQILDFIAACLLLSRIRSEQSKNYMPPGYYPHNA